MNERIRQLAQEAGMYVDVKGEPWPKWMGADECDLAYQKFAELIVGECAEIALREEHDPYECIKKHFGVEE